MLFFLLISTPVAELYNGKEIKSDPESPDVRYKVYMLNTKLLSK